MGSMSKYGKRVATGLKLQVIDVFQWKISTVNENSSMENQM